jgi:hypothetical protein
MIHYPHCENGASLKVRSVGNKIYVLWLILGIFLWGQCWAQNEARSGSAASQINPSHSTRSVDSGGSASKSSPAPLTPFRSLDQQAELLVKEVLDLSSDLAIVQEQEDNPAKHQLMVLVTFDPTKLFTLDYIQLEVDKEVVAAYQYSQSDIRALKHGAGHRLYLANLPAGMHEIYATMVGRVPHDPDYKSEVHYKFISGVSRTVVELNISSKAKGFPVLAIKEWN